MGEGRAGSRHGAGRLRLPRAQESAREPRVDSGEMSILGITIKKMKPTDSYLYNIVAIYLIEVRGWKASIGITTLQLAWEDTREGCYADFFLSFNFKCPMHHQGYSFYEIRLAPM